MVQLVSIDMLKDMYNGLEKDCDNHTRGKKCTPNMIGVEIITSVISIVFTILM